MTNSDGDVGRGLVGFGNQCPETIGDHDQSR